MAVYVHPETKRYSTESVKVYKSGVHSGIVGHPGTNTYHQSIENLPNQSGYTNYWKNDKAPPGGWSRQYAVGDDLSLNRSDMITDWKRHKKVFDDHSDPRRKYFAEYIGTPDGYTAYRLDFGDGSVEESSDDHTWHAHQAPWRMYYNSAEATDARLSVRRGETKEQYIASTGGSGGSNTPTEGVMEMRLIVANYKGKASVFSGLRGVVPMMAHSHEEAINGLVHAGADRQVYVSPEAMVEAMGPMEGKSVQETVEFIKGAG